MTRLLARLVALPAVLVALLLSTAGSASAASSDILRWDMSTCATDGAASPVIVFENPGDRGFGMQYWLDGEVYTSVLAPPMSANEYTLPPVITGDYLLQLTRGETPTAEHPGTIISAPSCPDGSPEPSSNAFPKQPSTGSPALWAAFGDPTCGEGDLADMAILPFTFGNDGDADGEQVGYIDDEEAARSEILAGSSGDAFANMLEGTHTYEIRTADGEVLASTTAEAPTCPAAVVDPTDDGEPTDDPSTPADGDDSGSGSPEDSGSDGTGPTPVIPAVVQTDGVGAGSDGAPVVAGGAALLLAGGALVMVRARAARPVRVRRHR